MLGTRAHRIIYLVLLALLGGSMVCSVWLTNLLWVLLGANWLLEGRWREKWAMARESRALHLYACYYALLLLGMLWTSNTRAGWSVLQVSLPLLVVPLVVLTTDNVTARWRELVLWFYTATVVVVAIISTVRLYTLPSIEYRDAVPYISHIRFALNCCVVVYFCTGQALRHWRQSRLVAVAGLAVTAWMLIFLVIIQSYTAIAVLVAVSFVLTVAYRNVRWMLWLWLVGLLALAVPVAIAVHDYYDLHDGEEAPLPPYTLNGRPYEHACDGLIENGSYVNNHVCREELRHGWEQLSTLPYDSLTASGYRVEPTLIRYLNGLGLTKDSAGMSCLDASQVAAIERGIANPVYESPNHLRKMVYVMLFEWENHRHFQSVVGFTMLQRFELWRATAGVIADHPLAGVGTGDAVDALHARLEAQGSALSGTTKRTHNQYLTVTAQLGLPLALLLALLLLRACLPTCSMRRRGYRLSPFMLAWVLTVLISFLTEDTLDTQAGIMLCTWFLAFRQNPESHV